MVLTDVVIGTREFIGVADRDAPTTTGTETFVTIGISS